MSDTNKTNDIGIFAVGNELRADDGVGIAVLRRLQERGSLPENIRLINAGGDPLRVVQEIMDLGMALVVDCADMELPPGTIRAFGPDCASFPYPPAPLSIHAIGLGQAIGLIQKLGAADRLYLVVVQPYRIEPELGLSPEMEKQVDKITDLVTAIVSNQPQPE